ncbi:hypothetical protein [Buchnera aphidicola]|nr:hypothetical protein [Buchnera aphidicola]
MTIILFKILIFNCIKLILGKRKPAINLFSAGLNVRSIKYWKFSA